MEFCCEESIWDACFHREEVEAIRDKWNREVLISLTMNLAVIVLFTAILD